MVVIRAKFDGTKVIIPESVQKLPAGDVLLIFENGRSSGSETDEWESAGESAFRKAWDNEEDAVYDSL